VNKSDQLLPWHGSKRQLAPAIIKLFPKDYERMVYVEPFCGSASVFWCKQSSKVEVLNDLDEELMNFLLTVKFHPRELARSLRLLPNSRALFAQVLDCSRCHSCGGGNLFASSIMRAARFCYLSHASFGGLRKHWAPRGDCVKRFHLLPQRFYRWATRLARATLECAPWQEVVEKHDSPEALWAGNPRALA